MGELGNTLSRARRARGITLEDVERDTHVSKRYLNALETEDFTIFPAPVYARGFLRTYSRYLGLNPEELIRVFPNGDLTVDITPLPTVNRPPAQLINVNWLVAVLAVLFLGGAALLLLNSGDGSAVGTTPRTAAGSGTTLTTPGQGAPLPLLNLPLAQGKVIGPVRPGLFPDFVGADKPSAEAVLRDNEMSYIIVEAANKNVPKGIVISQSPAPGAKAAPGATITLYVSSGQ
jgi:hypothetical protein